MKHDKPTIGDNQNPIQEQAVELINKFYSSLVSIDKHVEQSVLGKNKTIRDNSAFMAQVNSAKTLKEFKDWNIIIKAKKDGKDIHTEPLKSSKLEIVAGSQSEFGQYLIDKEDKQLTFDFGKDIDAKSKK